MLLEVFYLREDFFIILHSSKMFTKRLLQLLKNVNGMILYKVFTPLQNIIS